MASRHGQDATACALACGRALLKFISANETGATGSHQTGLYLPKDAAHLFTEHQATRGQNTEEPLDITWPDGRVTASRVVWYGQGTRSEFRLTRFGRDFPWFLEERIGDLLVLVPVAEGKAAAFILDHDGDIEDTLSVLGVQIVGTHVVYERDATYEPEGETPCIERERADFLRGIATFPNTEAMSSRAQLILDRCVQDFSTLAPDTRLARLFEQEYALFRAIEERLYGDDIRGPFPSVDRFLETAHTITNRRKARAGRSFENHLDYLLHARSIPHEMRPEIPGRPDIVIPGRAAYENAAANPGSVMVVGVKTTCKDRWRQVTHEAPLVQEKFLVTLQQGISRAQLNEMYAAGVSLVVPKHLQKLYPESDMTLLTVADFLEEAAHRASLT